MPVIPDPDSPRRRWSLAAGLLNVAMLAALAAALVWLVWTADSSDGPPASAPAAGQGGGDL